MSKANNGGRGDRFCEGNDEAVVGRLGTHTAGWGRDGNARVAGWSGEARTGGWAERLGTHGRAERLGGRRCSCD